MDDNNSMRVHGAVMFIAFGILIPIAVLSSYTSPKPKFTSIALFMISWLIVLLSLFLIKTNNSLDNNTLENVHSAMGWFCKGI